MYIHIYTQILLLTCILICVFTYMYTYFYINIYVYMQEKRDLKTEKLADFGGRGPSACYYHTCPWFCEAGNNT
jgi:hypothetical protein